MARRLCAIVLMLLLTAMTASAAEPGGRERAVELGKEGIALYNASRFVEAYEHFERAEALVHSPVFVVYMARTRRNTGKLLAARALYRQVQSDQIASDAPDTWRKAKRDAVDELELLSGRIPTLRITVTGGSGVSVTLNGTQLTPEILAGPIEVDPGVHAVAAQRGAEVVARRSVQVAEGGGELAVQLELDSTDDAPSPSPDGSELVVHERSRGSGTAIAGGLIAGLGAFSATLGGYIGLMGLAITQGDWDGDWETVGNVVIGMLVGGGVCMAVGFPILVVGLGDDESDETPTEARLLLRPGSASLSLTF